MDKDLRIMPPPILSTSSWQLDGTVNYVYLEGGSLRFLDIGQGSPLLLIHTLRTQLDYFPETHPASSRPILNLATDLPGHGYSSIPTMLVLMNRSFGNTSTIRSGRLVMSYHVNNPERRY